MAKLELYRTNEALDDISNAVDYFLEIDPDVAETFYASLKEAEKLLLNNPRIGSPRTYDNPRLVGMRMFRVSNFEKYLIFYQESDDRLEIIRVLHGARDIHAEFDSEF